MAADSAWRGYTSSRKDRRKGTPTAQCAVLLALAAFAVALAPVFSAAAQSSPASLSPASLSAPSSKPSGTPSGGARPQSVAEALAAAGFTPELTTEDGAPVIYLDVDGYNVALLAYNCAESGVCGEFVFAASFETDRRIGTGAVNGFNEAALAGRAFVDEEGAATIEHFFSLAAAAPDLLSRNVNIWRAVLADFTAFIAAEEGAAEQ